MSKPTREDAEQAVRTLLTWAGDDPDREGLLETPARVVRSYEEFYAGYDKDPSEYLSKTFGETDGYDQMVLVKDIRVESHCEHHMVPFTGVCTVAYVPDGRVVGLSKLARVVEAYSKRLQVQERLTQEIANCLQEALEAQGVAVLLRATHECMCTRGVHMPGTETVTSALTGCFLDEPECRAEFFSLAT